MKQLTLDTFLQAADDLELSRYKVLAAIKGASDFLRKNRLYPDLAELINIYNLLNEINDKKSLLNDNLPSKIVGFDLENKKALYEKERLSEDKTNTVFEFINWALPKIKEVIDEGKAIFEFIDKNMKVSEIGILPIYKKEGYFIIPDLEENTKLVYRYEMTLFPAGEETFHTLKTELIEAVKAGEAEAIKPEGLKMEMVKRYPELPNPAAYNIQIELEFPFVETVLPVAKRKLIRELAA